MFLVTTNSASEAVVGSLPWAVAQANSNPGFDHIRFALPTSQLLISLGANSLVITDQIHIDGESQGITIIGTRNYDVPSATTSTIFTLTADPITGRTSSGSTIERLTLSHAGEAIIAIENGSHGNWIKENQIGFYESSPGQRQDTKQVFSPGDPRVSLYGSFYPMGIRLIDSRENILLRNQIEGTYFGITFHGTSVGNSVSFNTIQRQEFDGILLRGQSRDNWLGPYNTISLNGRNGISLAGPGVTGNLVHRNSIGLDETASHAAGNGFSRFFGIETGYGITLTAGATANVIGHPIHGGNWIGANHGGGIAVGLTQTASIYGSIFLNDFSGVQGGPASGNWVESNVIGMNWSQSAVVGSQNHGIVISGSWYTTIRGNAIAGHQDHGVLLGGRDFNPFNPETTESSVITGNWIGVSAWGTEFRNQDFGLVALPGANYNYLAGNVHWPSGLIGSFFVDPNTVGNQI